MNAPISAPWTATSDEVVARLDSDVVRGLDDARASTRLERDGPNELVEAPPVPFSERVIAQFKDPLVALLLAAIVISLIAWIAEGAEGFPIEPVVIATIVILNAALGLWQEMRTEQAVAALKDMTSPHALVIRNGRVVEILSSELVVGDVLALEEGDAVSADCRMVDSAGLDIAEAPLTGESQPVTKTTDPLAADTALADRTNMVYSGTAVTRGRGRAVVVATGMRTEIGKIAELLGTADSGDTPLQRQISWLGKMLGILVVGLSVVVVGSVLLTSDDRSFTGVIDALVVGVSLAVAAVPEGLLAIMSIVLALGVQRMAEHGAIVKRLSSVETLGSASVICTDKTGTLTRNEMTIVRVVTPGVEMEITGSGYRPDGELRRDGRRVDDPVLVEAVERILAAGSLANDATLRVDEQGHWELLGDPTEIAFLVAEQKLGLTVRRAGRFTRVGEVPFDSDRKRMTTVHRDERAAGDESPLMVITKGAPDVIAARCSRARVDGRIVPMTDELREGITRSVDVLADDALRTLAVAYRPADAVATEPEDLERELIHLGVVGITDPPRPEAQAAIAEAHRAGVRVVMITGDHPRTAVRIGEQLGITSGVTEVATGRELTGADDARFASLVRGTDVFARVAPEHKLRIVEALQRDDEIVAMTGDGVNDAPALRQADIGVAMGINGTEVSKEASDMILADDNFATILRAVREGREIFANIQKFIRYLLASNAGEVLVMFIGVILAGTLGLTAAAEDGGLAVPLLATQILWINLLTDSALALALGVDPPVEEVMGRAPRALDERVVDRPMIATIAVIGTTTAVVGLIAMDLELRGGLLGGSGDLDTARTMVFTTVVLAQVFNAFNSRSSSVTAFARPFANVWLWLAVAATVALQVAVVHVGWLNDAFDTVPLDARRWAICWALASAVLFAEEVHKAIVRARA